MCAVASEDNWIDRCRVLLKYSHWVHHTVCDLLYVIYDRWEVIDDNACLENASVITRFMILSCFHFTCEWWSGIVANMLLRLLCHSCCYFNTDFERGKYIIKISLVSRKLFDFMQIRNFRIKIYFYISYNAWHKCALIRHTYFILYILLYILYIFIIYLWLYIYDYILFIYNIFMIIYFIVYFGFLCFYNRLL